MKNLRIMGIAILFSAIPMAILFHHHPEAASWWTAVALWLAWTGGMFVFEPQTVVKEVEVPVVHEVTYFIPYRAR